MTTARPVFEGPILAIDTSTRFGVLVLYDPRDGIERTASLDPAVSHGRELVPAIRQLMHSSGMSFHDLTRVAVGIGPGSYTGLRVGIAIAKTLAEVLHLPILAVDSLLLPVLDLPPGIEVDTCVCVADAQRGAVYASVYEKSGESAGWTKSVGPRILSWSELEHRFPQSANLIVTGPGLSLAAKLGELGLPKAPPMAREPSAAAMFRWLKEYADSSEPVPIDAIEPLYVRQSAAEEKRALADADHQSS